MATPKRHVCPSLEFAIRQSPNVSASAKAALRAFAKEASAEEIAQYDVRAWVEKLARVDAVLAPIVEEAKRRFGKNRLPLVE